ncbi:MAG: ATP-dependent Clp protease ATP-binding subunit [Clostridiales bacterium]|nr:ATP-dependent Clp protease ATP-binding subunit [Clostridiales bacterium]
MEMCIKCGQRPAVMFITKVEENKTSMEGYCLKCAKELGLAPVDKMFEKFGIGDDEIEQMNDQMNEFIESMGGPEGIAEAERNMLAAMQGMDGDEDSEGGAATAPISDFMQNMFGGIPMPFGENTGAEENPAGRTDKNKKEKNGRGSRRNGKKSVLDTYGTDLTALAALGHVDRVVGRNSEVDRVIQILNRRQKNNPVLLGEPGVGKTAVAEGLAMRIFEKNVPPKLFDARLYLIDFAALVAGTQFRGQFESRLKSLLKEAEERENVILVIDEIHNIVAAGDAEGAMSAANILKPALARGEIQIIGATTLNEYRKHIEKDSALERRFQPVMVDEPSVEESIEILNGIKDYYENYHKVKIDSAIIEQAVKMSERYITDRFLPDKAIDVIDEAGSRVNLRNKSLYELSLINDRMTAINAEEERLNSETGENADITDYEKLANLHSEKLRLEEKQKQLEEDAQKAEITFDDIAAVIEGWTKIPVHRLTEDESEKLLHLENRIHRRVIGQDEAVKAVSRAIRRGRADITSKKRPVSFIFAGPTGVGKTELVKTIAEVMFNNEEALVRIDMSEYMEKHAVSKLIGSPPGYVGYDDAGQLTEKIRRKPYSVILLDEIEKAHPDVFNIFLQILDDGRISDSHGKVVNFENTIIVMTTNSGSEFNANRTGFNRDTSVTMKDNVEKSLKQFFKPEFLNRIDDIVTFRPLEKPELKQIIDLMLNDIREKLEEKKAGFTITDEAKDIILEKGYDAQYGARPLKRAIQSLIEDKLAQLSLTGQIAEDSVVVCDAENGEISVKAASFE